MIFHPEFDSQRVFAPTTLGGMPTYIQKGINLSREERILWKRQERRRRKVQEVKAGVKRFMAMLFSHIGLSVLVVVYTIIGALIFVGLEQHKELATKDEARKVREETAKQLLHKLILKLDNWLVTYKMSSCNETSKLLRYLLTHSTPAVKSEEPKPRLNVTEPFFNTSNADNVNVTTTVAISMEPTSTALSHNPLYVNLAEALQYIIQEGFLNFTKNVVVLVTDQGWDGDDSKTELKWSIAGGVLYAVTVITTIGYGYTTPKTAQGKILTIFYALIGIPLVVLYLSNIGDYLADVFRALYSRTCRNTCENYCSISLFTSVVRSLVRRYYGKPVEDEIPNDEMIHIDGVAEGGNVPFRRRKRVLLKAFSLTDEECPNNESDLEANELSFTGVQKDPNHIQQTAETRPTPKTRCGPNFERLRTLFEEIGVYRIVHSPRLVSALNRTRSTLTSLMAPISKWIRQFSDEFTFPTDPLIISNKTTDVREGPPEPTLGFVQLGSVMNTTTGLPKLEVAGAPPAAISLPFQQTHKITARIEDGQSFTQESMLSNHVPVISTQKAALPIRLESAFGSTLASQNALEPTSVTITLPVGLTETIHTSEKQRYFTFDGHHRKFYLDARYLRSAQRQRRHRRRVAQQQKEKARSEILRLQNELSYGTLQRKEPNVKSLLVSDSAQDQTLEALSLSSTSTDEFGIPLVCWKDIDLDLEVRSIDDEEELARIEKLRRKQGGASEWSTFFVQHAQELTSCKMAQSYEKHKAKCRRQKRSIRLPKRENDVHRVLNWVKENENSTTISMKGQVVIPQHSASTGFSPFQSLEKEQRSVTLETIAQARDSKKSTSAHTGLIDTLPSQLHCSLQTARPTAAGSPNLVKYLHLGETAPTESPEVISLGKANQSHQGTLQSTKHGTDQKYMTLLENPFVQYPYYLQREQAKSLLQSTVIENPTALEKMKEEQLEKARAQGKSRLSIASSIGDVNSDVQVQLSYYSQQENGPNEDDLSLFTFGEGFSSDDDISKVTVPISLSLLIMTTYIFLGAIVFSITEDKDYLKWAYFCFITLSTIGFGDIVPGTKMDSEDAKEKLVVITLYVAIGLSVFAMCFKLMQEEVVDKVKWFASKVGIIKAKDRKKAEKAP